MSGGQPADVPLPRLLWLYRERLPMFAVYDHPKDFPQGFVARLWFTLPAAEAQQLTIRHRDLEVVRGALRGLGLHRLDRRSGDDPSIVETWI